MERSTPGRDQWRTLLWVHLLNYCTVSCILLYLSIANFWDFLLQVQYISRPNILLFTPLHFVTAEVPFERKGCPTSCVHDIKQDRAHTDFLLHKLGFKEWCCLSCVIVIATIYCTLLTLLHNIDVTIAGLMTSSNKWCSIDDLILSNTKGNVLKVKCKRRATFTAVLWNHVNLYFHSSTGFVYFVHHCWHRTPCYTIYHCQCQRYHQQMNANTFPLLFSRQGSMAIKVKCSRRNFGWIQCRPTST